MTPFSHHLLRCADEAMSIRESSMHFLTNVQSTRAVVATQYPNGSVEHAEIKVALLHPRGLSKPYLACVKTGSLYDTETGQCQTSNRRRIDFAFAGEIKTRDYGVEVEITINPKKAAASSFQPDPTKKRRAPSQKRGTKLDVEGVKLLRARNVEMDCYMYGQAEIAKRLNVSEWTIKAVRSRRIWEGVI